jgi:hypothetical protein
MNLSTWILGCGATVAAGVVASSPSFDVHAAATNRLIVAGIHVGSIADAGYNRTYEQATTRLAPRNPSVLFAPFGPKVPRATQLAAARAVVLVESGRQTTSTAVWQHRGSGTWDKAASNRTTAADAKPWQGEEE